MARPLCFVLMPFGRKPDAAGRTVDFDRVYQELIAPAIAQADMEPLRADEEMTGAIIHKPMFERLILCDYAVADLTTDPPPAATLAVANVPAFVHERLAGRLACRTVVATGIEVSRRADVVAAYEAAGFTPVVVEDLMGWTMLVAEAGNR